MGTRRDIIVVFCFLVFILFFLGNQIIPIVKDKGYNENKKKSELPIFDIRILDKYPNQFEAYLTDHFSLRGFFLENMGKINTKLWKKSPKPDKLIIGDDNWLYNVDKELDFYLGKRLFTEKQLKELLSEFIYRKKILDSMGIDMYIVVNPTKYSVYPEHLPKSLISNVKINCAVQVSNYFKKNSNLEIIYTKDFLMEHKQDYQLYFKSDNHWNEFAGYFVSKGIIRKIIPKKTIPDYSLKEFCIDTLYNYKGNLANMAADASTFSETIYKLTLCDNDAVPFERFKYIPNKEFPYPAEYQRSFKSEHDNGLNALIIRDSYGNALIPFLKNSFYHSTFIFDSWQYKFNLDIIKQEKPDVVIFMVLESFLPNIYRSGITQKK